MKIEYAAALLMLFTTPAFSDSKTNNGVVVECKLGGSGDSGFDITGDNQQGSADRSCKAACRVTKADKSTMEKSYEEKTVRKGFKAWLGGEAGVSGAPLRDPTLTSASCK
jgi:hypothetical protein